MQHDTLEIRPLNADDAAAFQQLRLAAIKDAPAAVWYTAAEEASQTMEQIQARIAHNAQQVVFGAFSAAALVGVAGLRRLQLAQVAHKGELWGVYVRPESRRDGMARRLLGELLEYARDNRYTQLKLAVNTENPRALALYRSLGFATFGIEPKALCVAGRFYDEEHMQLVLGATIQSS